MARAKACADVRHTLTWGASHDYLHMWRAACTWWAQAQRPSPTRNTDSYSQSFEFGYSLKTDPSHRRESQTHTHTPA
jgi:hypothetical protein